MEYIERDLSTDKIYNHSTKSKPFKESFILNIFPQFTLTLYECKRSNFIHHFINHENILITKECQVKLIDYDVCHSIESILR
jgi:serine/threonine protein kinase